MSKSTSFYPTPAVDTAGTHVVSHAGAVVLLRTAEKGFSKSAVAVLNVR